SVTVSVESALTSPEASTTAYTPAACIPEYSNSTWPSAFVDAVRTSSPSKEKAISASAGNPSPVTMIPVSTSSDSLSSAGSTTTSGSYTGSGSGASSVTVKEVVAVPSTPERTASYAPAVRGPK